MEKARVKGKTTLKWANKIIKVKLHFWSLNYLGSNGLIP